MTDEHRSEEHTSDEGGDVGDTAVAPPSIDLDRKVDIIAGAVADLEVRVGQMASELAGLGPKLNELLDRHPAGLGAASETTAAVAADVATSALEPVHTGIAALDAAASATRDDVLRALESVGELGAAIARLDDKTDDRLAAVRDAAMAPVADLQAMLAARSEKLDGRIDGIASAVQALVDQANDDGRAALLDALEELGATVQTLAERSVHTDVRPVTDRVSELADAVQALTWRVPELAEEVSALRAMVADAVADADDTLDGPAPADDVRDDGELVVEISERFETALAGLLRLVDERLSALRMAVSTAVEAAPPQQPPGMGGFEAGAVMGAAQAAWNRLEQRLDHEFDDLGRQLHAMESLIERATASAEAAATRPVVTGEQLRSAASSVKDSVLKAAQARRERRRPKGLNPGP